MSIPLLINSNKLYKEINDKANAMINKIPPIVVELTKIILGSEKNGKENLFKEALPILKKLIKNLSQEEIDKNSEIIINGYIDDITKLMLKMMEDQLQIAINYFNKKVYIDSFKSLLDKKYKEKNKKNLSESDFNDNCLDFIINPICDNVDLEHLRHGNPFHRVPAGLSVAFGTRWNAALRPQSLLHHLRDVAVLEYVQRPCFHDGQECPPSPWLSWFPADCRLHLRRSDSHRHLRRSDVQRHATLAPPLAHGRRRHEHRAVG